MVCRIVCPRLLTKPNSWCRCCLDLHSRHSVHYCFLSLETLAVSSSMPSYSHAAVCLLPHMSSGNCLLYLLVTIRTAAIPCASRRSHLGRRGTARTLCSSRFPSFPDCASPTNASLTTVDAGCVLRLPLHSPLVLFIYSRLRFVRFSFFSFFCTTLSPSLCTDRLRPLIIPNHFTGTLAVSFLSLVTSNTATKICVLKTMGFPTIVVCFNMTSVSTNDKPWNF